MLLSHVGAVQDFCFSAGELLPFRGVATVTAGPPIQADTMFDTVRVYSHPFGEDGSGAGDSMGHGQV